MSETPKERICKDCATEGVSSRRPAPHPGPRCATHWRATRKARKTSAHGKYLERTYGITQDQYQDLLEIQGGRCAICQRATGATKKLAVDHDHTCCNDSPTCGECVRMLLCGPCNSMLAHARDNVDVFIRAIAALVFPPAQEGEKWQYLVAALRAVVDHVNTPQQDGARRTTTGGGGTGTLAS